MNDNFEPAMAALFALLQSAIVLTFNATATANVTTLTGVSNFTNLFAGLAVFGPGIDQGTVIQALDEEAGTLTLSDPPTLAGTAVAFTTGFQTTGRRMQHWTQVSAQPALFLRRVGVIDEGAEPFTITTLECEAWVYCNAGKDPDVAPDSALTILEQLIRQALAPTLGDEDGRCTLGGLVYWARIEGKGEISPGDQDGQALAVIPIRITLP